MTITERLEFDASSAEDSIARLDSSLTTAVQSFQVNLADALNILNTVQVDVAPPDTTPITASIDDAVAAATPEVQLTFPFDGAAEITQPIDDAVKAADTVVEIDADTSNAETAIADLGSVANDAGANLEGLGTGISGLEAGAGLAAGETAGLASFVGGLGPVAKEATAGLTILAGATAEFFAKGLEAQGAQFRFNQVVGEFADRIAQVHVGDLTTDITTLGRQLGTTEADIQNSISKFFQLGTASGKSGEEVTNTTDQIVALAARARATNPALGSIASNIDGLSRGLARGGRFLAAYGIALTSTEINARALTDTGKSAANQLTIYDKAAAGAALATENLGSHLQEDITKGAENPIIKLDALKTKFEEFIEKVGSPLVLPIEDLLTKLEPTAEAFAKTLGDLIKGIAPSLPELGKAFSDLVIAAAPLVTDLVKLVTPNLILGIELFTSDLTLLAGGISAVVDVVGFFTDHLGDLGTALKNTTGPLGILLDQLNVSGDDLLALTGPAGIAASALFDVTGASNDLSGSIDPKVLKAFSDQLGGTGDAAKNAASKFTPAQAKLSAYMDTLKLLRQDAPGVLQAFSNVTTATSSQSNALENLAVSIRDANLSSDDLTAIATSLGVSSDKLQAFVDSVKQAIDDLTTSATSQLPTVSSAIQVLEQNAANLKQAFNPDDIAPALDKNIENITKFQDNLDVFVNSQLPNIAKLAAQNGPDFAEAIAQKIRDNPSFGPALEAKLKESDQVTANFVQHFHDVLAPEIINELGATGGLAAAAFGSNLVFPDISKLLQDATTAGENIGTNFNNGLASVLAPNGGADTKVNKAAQTGAQAIEQVYKDQLGINSPSLVAQVIGRQFTDGLALGLADGQQDVVAEAEKITKAAVAAATLQAVKPVAVAPAVFTPAAPASAPAATSPAAQVLGGAGGAQVIREGISIHQTITPTDPIAAANEALRLIKSDAITLVPSS